MQAIAQKDRVSGPGPLPAPRSATGRKVGPDQIVLGVLCALPGIATALGLPYYLLDRAARVRSPLHPMLRASGPVGLGFGVAGLAFFLFLWLYPIRKKVRWLKWTGPVGEWLRVHTIAGLVVPLLVAVHAGWRFEGLIGLGYFSMVVVCLSGIVGRYLYTHIPRSRNGVELSREQVANERRALVTEIAAATGLLPARVEAALTVDSRSYEGLGPLATLRQLAVDDITRRRAIASLESRLQRPQRGEVPLERGTVRQVVKLARREIALSQQSRMLEATRRVFALWHVAHRPFAVTALLAVLIHVAVAVAVGVVAS